MSGNRPVPLLPSQIDLESPEFAVICGWPFQDAFVSRLLRDDIPQRTKYGNCQIWIYCDAAGQPVGFGTCDVSGEYASAAGNRQHPYIPLLAVNPTIKSLGYGSTILRHLIAEAAVLAVATGCADILFLDVYTTSTKARALYLKSGFEELSGEIFDSDENNSYFVMAKQISIGPAATRS